MKLWVVVILILGVVDLAIMSVLGGGDIHGGDGNKTDRVATALLLATSLQCIIVS